MLADPVANGRVSRFGSSGHGHWRIVSSPAAVFVQADKRVGQRCRGFAVIAPAAQPGSKRGQLGISACRAT